LAPILSRRPASAFPGAALVQEPTQCDRKDECDDGCGVEPEPRWVVDPSRLGWRFKQRPRLLAVARPTYLVRLDEAAARLDRAA
jgi:hypothetical protein